MWTADSRAGYSGRVKLVKTELLTADYNPLGVPARQRGSSEAESPTQSARSVGVDRHGEAWTGRCMCTSGIRKQYGYACKCRVVSRVCNRVEKSTAVLG